MECLALTIADPFHQSDEYLCILAGPPENMNDVAFHVSSKGRV